VPLYTRGDDTGARQFRSLHAVQRHMVDANRCKMVYDDNEDEYADFYDYSSQYADEDDGTGGGGGKAGSTSGGAVAVAGAGGGLLERYTASGMELVVGGEGGGSGGGGTKVLGSRWLTRYYKQRPRTAVAPPPGARALAPGAAGPGARSVVAAYRALGVETRAPAAAAAAWRAQREQRRGERQRLNLAMKANILHNLPKNVTY
jgi:pre-60S factor REI1